MRKTVGDRLVEVLARDLAGEVPLVAHEDPALAVALAGDHRLGDRAVGPDEACRTGHDLRRGWERARGARERRQDELPGIVERPAVDGRGRLLVPAAAERRRDRGGVQLGQARAGDAEHPPVHLHEADERQRVGEVDDLVGEIRHAVDVGRPGDRRHEHLETGDRVRLDRAP